MNLKSFATFGLISFVTFSGIQGAFEQQISASEVTNQVSQSFAIAQAPKVAVVKTGNFVKAEQPTSGTARIINQNGKQYLDLGQNFKTSDKGPDLHVILYKTSAVPVSNIKASDYVVLGALKKFNGNQRYAIPANVNLNNYKSAAIWCRKFNATFGYAALGK